MIVKTENSKSMLTLIAEICGVVGLLFSIGIFFYSKEISQQQVKLESEMRQKEYIRLAGSDLMTKSLLIKRSEAYRNTPHKALVDSIIAFNGVFYKMVKSYAEIDLKMTDEEFDTHETQNAFMNSVMETVALSIDLNMRFMQLSDSIPSLVVSGMSINNAYLFYSPSNKNNYNEIIEDLSGIVLKNNKGVFDNSKAVKKVAELFYKKRFVQSLLYDSHEKIEFLDFVMNFVLVK